MSTIENVVAILSGSVAILQPYNQKQHCLKLSKYLLSTSYCKCGAKMPYKVVLNAISITSLQVTNSVLLGGYHTCLLCFTLTLLHS